MPDHRDLTDEPRDELGREHPALGEALRELSGAAREVPARVDETIARAASAHFAGLGRPARRPWRIVATAAVAAVLAGAAWLGIVLSETRPPSPAARVAGMDLDGSGSVDILDAFDLARRLETGETLAPALDVNADGVVDGSDVDLIALEAVSLGGETG